MRLQATQNNFMALITVQMCPKCHGDVFVSFYLYSDFDTSEICFLMTKVCFKVCLNKLLCIHIFPCVFRPFCVKNVLRCGCAFTMWFSQQATTISEKSH